MRAPADEQAEKFNKKYHDSPNTLIRPDTSTRGLPVVPVVLDPIISKHLRPHQIEGCIFFGQGDNIRTDN